MRTFKCVCDNTIFFENSQCVACGQELGWCPVCQNMTALTPAENGLYHCGWKGCGSLLAKCHNYAVEHVCNRCVAVQDGILEPEQLCDCCRFNDTIPDLSVAENRDKWAQLEAAKRRLIYMLDLLGLPYGTESEGFSPGLSFDFKGDVQPSEARWHDVGEAEQVYTGHADGKITINIREADSVEREKARVQLQEPKRTLVGHFRHEIAHYFWDLLVKGRCESECAAVFGDPDNPSYAEALKRHYEQGPPADWQQSFISAYATMHPWEDFAESFAAYLDMSSVLDTTIHLGLAPDMQALPADFDERVTQYAILGVKLNELNRAMGLLDIVPEVFVPPVVEKMRFIHTLVRQAANGRPAVPVMSGTAA